MALWESRVWGWSPTETDVQLIPGRVGVEGMVNSCLFSCPSKGLPTEDPCPWFKLKPCRKLGGRVTNRLELLGNEEGWGGG